MSNEMGLMSGKEKQQALVPRLRFPEFRDAGEWRESALSGICDVNPAHDGLPDSFIYIDLESVEAGTLKTRKRIERANAPSRAQRYLRDGDIVYQTVRPYQRNNLLSDFGGEADYVASTGYAQLRARESIGFLYQLIHTDSFVARVLTKCTGSSYPAINSSDLESVSVWIPPTPAEQQKIADCLGSLDDLIAAEGRKLAALRDHKNGLMQQLFPREGETRPRLRFQEFLGAGDWEVKKAGDLFGQRKKKGEPGLPIYSVTINDGMILRATFDRNFYDIEDPAGNKKAYKNDIVYNMMRMWQGACGVAPEDCMVSPAYVVLKPKAGVCPTFFDFLFKRPDTLHRLTAHSRGLTLDRLRLYFEDFASIPLLVPTEAEQQRIADCLSSLDTLIATQVSELDALRTHKRGLMQQLFPGEIEG